MPIKLTSELKHLLSLSSAPVILDPNTAHPHLTLSDDLTSLTYLRALDDPDAFAFIPCVLGSEGFISGTHCWDVEVGDNSCWSLGLMTAPKQRKEYVFSYTDFWCVEYMDGGFMSPIPKEYSTCFTIKKKLQRVRVLLDWERGKVSFSDPETNTHLCLFTSRFTKTVFPFFYTNCPNPLSLLPVKLFVKTEKHSYI